MTYLGLRSTTDIKEHHYSFGSELSNFFQSKFSFYACEILVENIQTSGTEVLRRQRPFQARMISREYMWCTETLLRDKHYAVLWMMMLP